MTRLTRVLMVVGLILGPGAKAVGQGLDLPSILLPQAKTLPAPDWLKAGVRLTYYSACATVAGSPDCYWRDDRGDWVGRNKEDMGLKYSHGDAPRASGHGFTQIDVIALGDKVVLSTRSLGIFNGTLHPLGTVAHVGAPGAGGEWWVNPKSLKDVQPKNTKELVILPMPYKIGDKAYDTIRFQGYSPNGENGWNYDLSTGILVHSHFSATSRAKAFTWGGDTTTLGQNTFLGVRQLQIPWANVAPPTWIATVKGFQYEGTQGVNLPGVGSSAFPLRAAVQVTDRGKNWLLGTLTSELAGAAGLPATASSSTLASGPAQIGGLWVPPAAIPGLAAGMTLDKDAFAGSETKVTFHGTLPNGAKAVVIKEESPGYATEWTYDAASGVLQAVRQEDKSLNTVIQLRLTQVN